MFMVLTFLGEGEKVMDLTQEQLTYSTGDSMTYDMA